MKKIGILLAVSLGISAALAGCGKGENTESTENGKNSTKIELSDEGILVDGENISVSEGSRVYAANDIIFYLEGQGIAYGEGTGEDEHSQEEADAHTVVHITEPGDYEVSGKLSAGQLLIDLGEDADEDETAVVNLTLNNVDITCTVAPAVLFLNVYECGSDQADEASKDVDLTGAGVNLLLADGSENYLNGAYVAKIYEEDSVEMNDEGTEVTDAKKLWKFDGTLYSRMSMNLYGDTGVLNIDAENEGLNSELHMTIHGGNINIYSGNDGINVNEDGVSVFTMAGGNLNIVVTGETGEGDGIDSNGWLVINGGTVRASANADSQDSGIDADMGIHLNGGTVVASGNMMDMMAESAQPYKTFMLRERLEGGTSYAVKDEEGNTVMEVAPENAFQMLLISDASISEEANYTLWNGETQAAESMSGGMMGPGGRPGGGGPGGMQPPMNGERPEMPEGMEPGEMPEGLEPPEGMAPGEMPEGMERPQGGRGPGGMQPPEGFEEGQESSEKPEEVM